MIQKKYSIARLPSLPTIAVEILRIYGDPDAPVQKIAQLVQADPAIASKILKTANSSRYGLAREVSTLNQAIALLGKSKITPLVLGFTLSAESMVSAEHAPTFRHYWLRSFVQATAAESLGRLCSESFAAECFIVNLLAGIGQLGLLKSETNAYIGCVERSRRDGVALSEIEQEIFGLTHHALSVEMLTESGLPERCVNAVRALIPGESVPESDAQQQKLVAVTAAADAFARYLCDNEPGVALIVLTERLAALNSLEVTLESLTEKVRLRLDESSALFNIDPSTLPNSEDLLHEALDQLAEFTAMMHDPIEPRVPSELMEENGRLKNQVRELLLQTTTDPLTGAANRAFFDRRLSELNQQCMRRAETMGIAVVDIDHFKRVNDTYGHLAGDHVLKIVAQALGRVTRSNETLSRYGGEEFVVLMEDIAPAGQAIMGERLRSCVERLQVEFEGQMIPLTISVGVACGVPVTVNSGKELFAIADSAMYRAKQQGRNRVIVDTSVCPENYESGRGLSAACHVALGKG